MKFFIFTKAYFIVRYSSSRYIPKLSNRVFYLFLNSLLVSLLPALSEGGIQETRIITNPQGNPEEVQDSLLLKNKDSKLSLESKLRLTIGDHISNYYSNNLKINFENLNSVFKEINSYLNNVEGEAAPITYNNKGNGAPSRPAASITYSLFTDLDLFDSSVPPAIGGGGGCKVF